MSKVETIVGSVRIQIDQEKCVQCGMCLEVCPFGLPVRQNESYVISKIEMCTECSACKKNCPVGAIIMNEQKGCGCLWDVKSRKKTQSSCCSSINDNDSCCC